REINPLDDRRCGLVFECVRENAQLVDDVVDRVGVAELLAGHAQRDRRVSTLTTKAPSWEHEGVLTELLPRFEGGRTRRERCSAAERGGRWRSRGRDRRHAGKDRRNFA